MKKPIGYTADGKMVTLQEVVDQKLHQVPGTNKYASMSVLKMTKAQWLAIGKETKWHQRLSAEKPSFQNKIVFFKPLETRTHHLAVRPVSSDKIEISSGVFVKKMDETHGLVIAPCVSATSTLPHSEALVFPLDSLFDSLELAEAAQPAPYLTETEYVNQMVRYQERTHPQEKEKLLPMPDDEHASSAMRQTLPSERLHRLPTFTDSSGSVTTPFEARAKTKVLSLKLSQISRLAQTPRKESDYPEFWVKHINERATRHGGSGIVKAVDTRTYQITFADDNGHTYYLYGPDLTLEATAASPELPPVQAQVKACRKILHLKLSQISSKQKVSCDQCQLMTIQGTPCHETGCPKSYINPRTGQPYPIPCFQCGYDYIPEGKVHRTNAICSDCANPEPIEKTP